MSITISKVFVSDAKQLRQVAIDTFKEAFAESNSEEDMERYLEANMSDEKLRQELLHPDSAFYFALFSEEIAGYLKVNFGKAQTENKIENALEIERIYLLKKYQGKKIGQALMQKAFDIAREMKKETIWLGVWENNHKAILFYEKYGFTVFDKHVFKLGNDEQTDLMMRTFVPQ